MKSAETQSNRVKITKNNTIMKKIYLFATALACMTMSAQNVFAVNNPAAVNQQTEMPQTSDDIVISPASGDISAALSDALGTGNAAKNITINLAAGVRYTLSRPIMPSASLIINGAEGAVIDASNLSANTYNSKKDDEKEGSNTAFILMSDTPSGTQTDGYYRVEQVTVKDVTIKGLKSAFFSDGDNKKAPYCVVNFTIDNVVVESTPSTKIYGLLLFKRGGFKDLTIRNSTFYGNGSKNLKAFTYAKADLQSFGYDTAKNKHNITYQNNTFVNVLAPTNEEGWSKDPFTGTDYVNYDIQANIWYNCGLNITTGLIGQELAPNAKKLFSKNSYYNADEETNVVKNQAVLESLIDTSNDIVTTDPTFADISKADFHVHPGSLQAKMKTGDPRWLVSYDAAQALPADIILNLPLADNITKKLNAAKSDLDNVGDINIILAANKYSLTESITTSGSITITGTNATLNCSRLTGPMIILEGTKEMADNINADGTVGAKSATYKHIETVSITGVKTSLKKSTTIVKDIQKTLVDNVIIEDCVFELEGNDPVFDFSGYPANLQISSSTLWSSMGHKGNILLTGGRVRDLDKSQNTLTQAISIDYCTLYQIAQGTGFNKLANKASRTLALTLTNSIIYDCTTDGEEVCGWMGGAESDGPKMTYNKNTYFSNGKVQAGWTDEDEALDGRDVTGTAFDNDPKFFDVDAGDFAIDRNSPQAQAPEGQTQYGDPRWSTWLADDFANRGLFDRGNDTDFHGNVSGINHVETNTQREDGKWYTLNGVEIEKPTKPGVYIHNNKKVMVR